ncbi:hypothetical protein SCUP515_13062 [Seiridium cupressi]
MNKKPSVLPQRRRGAPLAERSNTTSPLSARWACKDSDESSPSRHSSIYDAEYISDASMTTTRKASPRPIEILSSPQPRPIRETDLRSDSPLSRLELTPFLYGHGTELHPIAEKRSIATLRTTSFSTSDLSSLVHGAPGPLARGHGSRAIPQRLRRRQSFSLDDLDHFEHYKAIAMAPSGYPLEPVMSSASGSQGSAPVQADNIHQYPHSPPFSPVARKRTPEDIFKLIRSRDIQTGNIAAAHTWVRLAQRSPSVSGRRTFYHHPSILNGRPVPARRESPVPAPEVSRISVIDSDHPPSHPEKNPAIRSCRRCGRPIREEWSL